MIHLNLLRNLPEETPDAGNAADPATTSPTSGAWKRIVVVLLVLLAGAGGAYLGAGGAYLWMHPEALERFLSRASADRAAPHPARLKLELEASQVVFGQQSNAIEWLYELEALTPPGGVITHAVFLTPGEFRLRGTVPSDAALSRIQESLVLLPEMELRLSHSDPAEDGQGHAFLFAGSLRFSRDTLHDAGNRVLDGDSLRESLDRFLESAREHGLAPGTPDAGEPASSAWLTAHPLRVVLRGEHEALREFINMERHRASPFAIRRVTLDVVDGETVTVLDILAYTR